MYWYKLYLEDKETFQKYSSGIGDTNIWNYIIILMYWMARVQTYM